MAGFIARTEGVYVSHHYVAKLCRETGVQPHRHGTFKLSKDPAFAEKVADVVGLYLDPPGGAVVLSIDEKTQIQALDRTQPLLPIQFDATEKRTHDYIRHGTTNLFAALNVGTGEVYGECKPTRDGADFLAFLRKAVKPHSDTDIHVVLDNLSTHTTPEVAAWLQANPHVHFHLTPVGSSWINQIETWFGIITRQSIRRGTFTSVTVLVKQIRDHIAHWNTHATPFTWTATADEILAKVALVQTNIKKLVDNNAKLRQRNHGTLGRRTPAVSFSPERPGSDIYHTTMPFAGVSPVSAGGWRGFTSELSTTCSVALGLRPLA
jgi:transposase